jgi:hypothetical protein
MPGAMTAKSQGFFSGLNLLLWGLWLVLVIWVCYHTKFWINNDTIGSLDVARSLRQMDWRHAVNLHWGMVYAALLAVLPLKGATSWLQIHCLNGILLVGSQLCLYLSLRRLGVRHSISTLLCLAWGAANFASGGAVYITSDVTLGFMGSLYLYALVRAGTLERISSWRWALLLGLLHGLAWMTKNIALVGLAAVPLMVSAKLGLDSGRKLFRKERFSRILTFLVAYAVPILFLAVVWGAGIKGKYSRFSWGDSGAYNYAYFVRQAPELNRAIEAARLRLPPYGTFWWSDISLSLAGWDHQIHFNLPDQIKTVIHNLKNYFSGREILQGAGLLGLLCLGWAGLAAPALRKTGDYFLISVLSAVSGFILLMYLSVFLSSKYLPFPVLFLLPAGGRWAENIFQTQKRPRQILISILLAACILHGIAAAVYASLRLAPQGEHFAVAGFIHDHRGSEKDPGPVGAYLYPQANLYHHGVIAHLLDAKTAELTRINDNFFSALFMPKIVLLVLPAEGAVPVAITVNGKQFVLAQSWVWGKLEKREKLVLYNPDAKPSR